MRYRYGNVRRTSSKVRRSFRAMYLNDTRPKLNVIFKKSVASPKKSSTKSIQASKRGIHELDQIYSEETDGTILRSQCSSATTQNAWTINDELMCSQFEQLQFTSKCKAFEQDEEFLYHDDCSKPVRTRVNGFEVNEKFGLKKQVPDLIPLLFVPSISVIEGSTYDHNLSDFFDYENANSNENLEMKTILNNSVTSVDSNVPWYLPYEENENCWYEGFDSWSTGR